MSNYLETLVQHRVIHGWYHEEGRYHLVKLPMGTGEIVVDLVCEEV